jgi:uncharacterized protein (DUF488 family)
MLICFLEGLRILTFLKKFGIFSECFTEEKYFWRFCRHSGASLKKIKLQKPDYEFIPYLYGCFSYSANADLTVMSSKGQIKETETTFQLADSAENFLKIIQPSDAQLLSEMKTLYGNMSSESITRQTYINFPYWAIKSTIAQNILTESQYQKVKQKMPLNDSLGLFTIGYEGISLEEYFNRLIKNDIKLLADVRNSPFSMKYGFNKNQLIKFCQNLGIEYAHFPEVGIVSDKRQSLNNQGDYDKLFEDYCQNNLQQTLSVQNQILDFLHQKKRVALTCFEANICQCHRKHLAENLQKISADKFKIEHL